MKIYLVGGAVRDLLSGEIPHDKDYVVVGSNEQEMLEKGFQKVGVAFPVFLHPETGDEYALARREEPTGEGHKNFAFETSEVSLLEDLSRRDFTINAMAKDMATGEIIDPFGGEKDLKNRHLRHVGEAFKDDPLRVYRAARFAAQKNFTVSPSTLLVMQSMKNSLHSLSPERVTQEMVKAFNSPFSEKFIRVLYDANILKIHFPEIENLVGVEQPSDHHGEGDAFQHTLLALQVAPKNAVAQFAVLCHDLGKALTPKGMLPKHPGHAEAGVPLANALSVRLKVTAEMKAVAEIVTAEHMRAHVAHEMRASKLIAFLVKVGALRQGSNFEHFLSAHAADEDGRETCVPRKGHNVNFLRAAAEKLRGVDMTGCTGKEDALQRRIAAFK